MSRCFNAKGKAAAAAAADMSAAPTLVPAPANNNNIMITTATAPKTTTAAAKLKGWHAANAAAFAATMDAARVRARACKLAQLARKGRRTAAVLAAGAPQPDNAPADATVSSVALPLASVTATAETAVPASTAVLEPALIEVPIASDDDDNDNTNDGAVAIAAPMRTAAKLKGWHAAAKAAFAAKASVARSRARVLLCSKKDGAAALIEVDACAADAAGSDDNTSSGRASPLAAASADAGRRASMRARMMSAWAALAGRVANAAAAPKAATKAPSKRALPSLTAVRGYFSACVAPGKNAVNVVA